MVNFKIVGEIQTKQRPRARIRGNFAQVYTPKETVYYENYIKSEYQRQVNKWFGNEPLSIKIDCRFKAPKEVARLLKLGYNIICDNQKDCDNLAKIICDGLNGIAYTDDRQIINLEVSKSYDLESEYVIVQLDYAKGYNLKKAKEIHNVDTLINRYNELKAKPKLDKRERKRLDELEQWLRNVKLV